MKNVQNYSIKILFLLTLTCILDHNLQAGELSSAPMITAEMAMNYHAGDIHRWVTAEEKKNKGERNYDKFLDCAQALEQNNRFEEALEIYYELIVPSETITKQLRSKAILHAAKILYTQVKTSQTDELIEANLRKAQRLLGKILNRPIEPVHVDDLYLKQGWVDRNEWAQARLLDAELSECQMRPSPDYSNENDCRFNVAYSYSKILLKKNLNIDPTIMFKAAYRLGKLCYNFPQHSFTLPFVEPENRAIYIVNEMIKAYNSMTREQQQNAVDIHEFNKLKKWGNNARLQKAERLLQPGREWIQSDYRTAFQLYHDIIGSPESDVDAKTLNEARVNLADMYRKGQGTLMDIDEAERLYASVLAQQKNNSGPEELSYYRAHVWFDRITQRKRQQEAL